MLEERMRDYRAVLITTYDYRSDSCEFAKGKPLMLPNGSNLLYLLEKHGTNAKIDIKVAKRLEIIDFLKE